MIGAAARLHDRDAQGRTALTPAPQGKHEEVVKLLEAAGALG
jgi:hypothetical protein